MTLSSKMKSTEPTKPKVSATGAKAGPKEDAAVQIETPGINLPGTQSDGSDDHPPSVTSPPSKDELIPIDNRSPGKPFPFNLTVSLELVLGQNDLAYSVFHDRKNDYVLQVGSREMDLRIRMIAEEEGKMLRRSDIAEINEYLQAWTETNGERADVFYRVRPIDGGVELDVGDSEHSRIRITAGNVEVR